MCPLGHEVIQGAVLLPVMLTTTMMAIVLKVDLIYKGSIGAHEHMKSSVRGNVCPVGTICWAGPHDLIQGASFLH